MNRFYVLLSSLLLIGSIIAGFWRAWGLGAVLLVLGVAMLLTEYWTHRTHRFVPLENGPDVGMERTKAQGLQNALHGAGRPLPDPPSPTQRVVVENKDRRPSRG